MDNNSHKSYKDCDTAAVGKFISLLHGSGNYKRVSYYPVDEKSHFERFGYVCGEDKISVVYDTKAKILSLTAKDEQIKILSRIYETGEFPSGLPQTVAQEQKLPKTQPKQKEKLPARQEKGNKKLPAKQSENKQKLPAKKADGQKLPAAQKQENPPKPQNQNGGKQNSARQKKNDKELHTAEKSNVKQNSGKQNSAQQKKNDKELHAAEKRLKKLLPCAFEYLSALAKKDLTSALTDIYNDAVRLSDYSGLLVSPYRGLERLIYDLQTSEGIKVKMIGQAYEKRDDGSYCLKSGYRKRIKSVIYNEVMSALYTEYFEKRNFYLHSNNSLSTGTRAINDLSEARKIFDNLLSIIEYNCEKLREIRFSVKPAEE